MIEWFYLEIHGGGISIDKPKWGKDMIIDNQMTELGYDLKTYRVRNNITQHQLASKLGVSTNTIHLWETKVCKPSMGSLIILSDMLNEPLITIIEKANRSYY